MDDNIKVYLRYCAMSFRIIVLIPVIIMTVLVIGTYAVYGTMNIKGVIFIVIGSIAATIAYLIERHLSKQIESDD